MARLDTPLTFPKAAQAIGWQPDSDGRYRFAGRRLRRLVLLRERQTGRAIAIRDRAGRPIQVTLGSLSRYLAELRPARTERLGEELRAMVLALERRIRDVVDAELERRMARIRRLPE